MPMLIVHTAFREGEGAVVESAARGAIGKLD
jgi:hypothetical protein